MKDQDLIGLLVEALQNSPAVASADIDEIDSFQVVLKDGCVREFVMFPEDGFQKRLNASMYAHTAATYESLATEFKGRAGQAYADDREQEAASLKALAKEFEKRGKEFRRKQKAEAGE